MKLIFVFAAMMGALALPVSAQEPDPLTLTELRAKYADEDSQFIELDGAEIHYKDEGSGPPIVLLHASYTNLETWRYVVDALKSSHRVIRLDFPNVGLSGPETKTPDGGKFHLIERNVEIVDLLVEALDLGKVNIIATSSGGSVGFRYASYNADQVNRLLLINSAGMPRTRQTNPNRERADRAQWDGMTYRPMEFWDLGFGTNFPSEADPPEWLMELVFDINRRKIDPDGAEYYFNTGDPETIISKITAPTMIMWGMDNPTVMHLEGTVFSHWLTSAPSLVKKYPGLGHYPYIEDPDTVVPDIVAFFAGEFDDQMRQTTRAQVAITAQ